MPPWPSLLRCLLIGEVERHLVTAEQMGSDWPLPLIRAELGAPGIWGLPAVAQPGRRDTQMAFEPGQEA